MSGPLWEVERSKVGDSIPHSLEVEGSRKGYKGKGSGREGVRMNREKNILKCARNIVWEVRGWQTCRV